MLLQLCHLLLNLKLLVCAIANLLHLVLVRGQVGVDDVQEGEGLVGVGQSCALAGHRHERRNLLPVPGLDRGLAHLGEKRTKNLQVLNFLTRL